MHGVCAQNVNRNKQKMENKIKQILAIAENAVDLPCLNVTPSGCADYCTKCKDKTTNNGKTCMLYALYRIKQLCK